MKRLLLSLLACAIMVLNLVLVSAAEAQPLMEFSLPGFSKLELTETQQDLLKQMETEIVPQLTSILTPEQQEQFSTAVSDGKSFRKAFKALTLTPDQKTQLASILKSIPKKDIFASLTPEQKKTLFLKNKEVFIPTPEEISERISAGMKKKEMFAPTSELAPSSEEISEKINAGLKKKEAFMPTPEEILDKINAKIKAITEAQE